MQAFYIQVIRSLILFLHSLRLVFDFQFHINENPQNSDEFKNDFIRENSIKPCQSLLYIGSIVLYLRD